MDYRLLYALRHTYATLVLNATQELAGVSAALGEADAAFEWLEKAYERRSNERSARTLMWPGGPCCP